MGYEATFLNRHPYAEDLILLIEVAEATLSRDCNLKKRIYTQAGVAYFW